MQAQPSDKRAKRGATDTPTATEQNAMTEIVLVNINWSGADDKNGRWGQSCAWDLAVFNQQPGFKRILEIAREQSEGDDSIVRAFIDTTETFPVEEDTRYEEDDPNSEMSNDSLHEQLSSLYCFDSDVWEGRVVACVAFQAEM